MLALDFGLELAEEARLVRRAEGAELGEDSVRVEGVMAWVFGVDRGLTQLLLSLLQVDGRSF